MLRMGLQSELVVAKELA